jgi:hypothetical protein
LGGSYYYRLPLSKIVLEDSYYELPTDRPQVICYSHLVIGHYYPMVQYKSKNGNSRFIMSIVIKEDIFNDIKKGEVHVVQ